MNDDVEAVWLKQHRTYGWLVSRGAYYSKVRWTDENGVDYEDDVENDEYEFWNERAIEFESDE